MTHMSPMNWLYLFLFFMISYLIYTIFSYSMFLVSLIDMQGEMFMTNVDVENNYYYKSKFVFKNLNYTSEDSIICLSNMMMINN